RQGDQSRGREQPLSALPADWGKALVLPLGDWPGARHLPPDRRGDGGGAEGRVAARLGDAVLLRDQPAACATILSKVRNGFPLPAATHCRRHSTTGADLPQM